VTFDEKTQTEGHQVLVGDVSAQGLSMPYDGVLPPLSTAEFQALASSIRAEGVGVPVLITEDDRLLDGKHRLAIDPGAPRKVVPGSAGWSDAECRAFVLRCNLERRNLSPSQRKEVHQQMKRTARDLRRQDPRTFTQEKVAELLGVARSTVAGWFGTTNVEPVNGCDGHRPDARVTVPPTERGTILRRCREGEPQAQVAADYGVTQQAVSRLVNLERRREQLLRERQQGAAEVCPDGLGIVTGDFRQAGARVPDGSVDLIVTDPPYLKDDLPIYGDLAAFAARVLRPGGLCMVYAGVLYVPTVVDLLRRHLEYVWTFNVRHLGGAARFYKYRVKNGWKPVFCFAKPPLETWWGWSDDTVSGGREKSDHPWQQAEAEAAQFIEALCPAGGLMCDPCCGSGTTCAAARKLGRRFVAFEIDAATAEAARARVAAAEPPEGEGRAP
jgi:site-specific DNA-methyltransferase (adenine-specific)